MAMVFSPGMFHASASFLPSSFAMYTTMAGMASFMNWRGGLKTAHGIFWFALGGVLGWPFSIALCLPFLFEEIVFASLSNKDAFIDTIMRFIRGFVAGLLVLVSKFRSRQPITNLDARHSSSLYQDSSTRSLSSCHSILCSIIYSVEREEAQRSTGLSHGISTFETSY